MKVYLAARYSRREELLGYASDLRTLGHVVTSRWIEGEHEASNETLARNLNLSTRLAYEDIEDLVEADVVVAFTEDPANPIGRGRGGRHVEAGIILGWNMQRDAEAPVKRLIVVGPIENVFYALVERYETWHGCLAALARAGGGVR